MNKVREAVAGSAKRQPRQAEHQIDGMPLTAEVLLCLSKLRNVKAQVVVIAVDLDRYPGWDIRGFGIDDGCGAADMTAARTALGSWFP